MLRTLPIPLLLVCLPVLAVAQITRVDTSGIEGKFIWLHEPDVAWSLQLKKDQTYACVYWNGWSGDTTYATGTYKLVHGRLKLRIRNRPDAGGKFADEPTFDGKRFYVYRTPTYLTRWREPGVAYCERRPMEGRDERYALFVKKRRPDNSKAHE